VATDKPLASWLIALCAWAAPAAAEVVEVDVVARDDVAAGAAYGTAGPYERLRGTLRFSVDPKAPANQSVTDLDLARTNSAGLVEFTADFYLLKPKDVTRGNRALLFEVSNRGRKGILPMLSRATASLDPTEPRELGDGFLLEQGFSVLWVGWQLDPPLADASLLRVYPPTTEPGLSVTGLVRSDFVVREPGVRAHSLGDGDHVPYPVADPDSDAHTLTVRDSPLGERETIPRGEWQFARVDGNGSVVPDPTHVYFAGGFEPKRIYEVVYTAKNPPLAGLGLAAIRDAVTRLKHEGAAELGIDERSYDRALAFGISQSGRLLRTFLYDGFNGDEHGRRVFDGVLAHIAGGARGGFNTRFAQPSRSSSSYLYPNEVFPFSDTPQLDSVSGQRGGLLDRLDSRFMPRIFYTNSSNEYWRGSAALTHVTPDARRDFPPPEITRIYLFAGTQHGPAAFPPRVASGRLAHNPNAYSWFLRALLLRLDAWVARDVPPPPSAYPTLADGSLVPRSQLRFPAIPRVDVPRAPSGPVRLDYGPSFAGNGIATIEPPRVGAPFPVLLPQVDVDGNEIAGLRSPELAVPLATYMGWQLYRPELGRDDELVSLQGSFAPFPLDAAERQRTGDPRRAILERYPDRKAYLALVEQMTKLLIADGYLRSEDLPHVVAQAADRWRVLVEERDVRRSETAANTERIIAPR
jgi:hypothetical protein